MRSVLFAFALVACASTPSPSRCVAGQVSMCPCSGGGSGSQACGPDGVFGVCSCAAADGGPDALTDGPADASTEATLDIVDAPSLVDLDPRCSPRPDGRPIAYCERPVGGCFLLDDERHCGNCETACAAGMACRGGRCEAGPDASAPDVVFAVDGALPDGGRCPAGHGLCSGRCVNLWRGALDTPTGSCRVPECVITNCGACGRRCAAGQACIAGECAAAVCEPLRALCDRLPGNCVDLGVGVRLPDGSTEHCGLCGNTCATGVPCIAGQCG